MTAIDVELESGLTILPVRGGQKGFERVGEPGVDRLSDSIPISIGGR